MVVVPALTAVTNPEFEIVATLELLDDHGFKVAAVPEPVNCVVKPTHKVETPVIVGFGFTVTE